MKNRVILSGKKSTSRFVGRPWETISKWIAEKGFPGRRIDRTWEADAAMIIDWRKNQLRPEDGDQNVDIC